MDYCECYVDENQLQLCSLHNAGEPEPEIILCPLCGRAQDEAECFLGHLGQLTHYRCRYCGGQFSSEGDDSLSEAASYFDQGGEA